MSPGPSGSSQKPEHGRSRDISNSCSLLRLCPCKAELLCLVDQLTVRPSRENIRNIEKLLAIHTRMTNAGHRILSASDPSHPIGVGALTRSKAASNPIQRPRPSSRRERRRKMEDDEVVGTDRLLDEAGRKSVEGDIRHCEVVEQRLNAILMSSRSPQEFQRLMVALIPCLAR